MTTIWVIVTMSFFGVVHISGVQFHDEAICEFQRENNPQVVGNPTMIWSKCQGIEVPKLDKAKAA